MSRTASFWLAFALLFSGVMMIWQIWKRQQPRGLATAEVLQSTSEPRSAGEQQAWIHDFELTERSGRTFDSGKEMPGQVWVTSVFFPAAINPAVNRIRLSRNFRIVFASSESGF